ncbi:shikimate dehydrogenase [Oceanobacillus sp. CAU 1775]
MSLNFALIGYPIQHSMSPWLHKSFLQKAGLEGEYSLFEIHPDDNFDLKISELKERNLNGFNITFPYKEKIIDYLDEVDETVQVMGAVNTVLLQDGKWIGYNTDGAGYLRAIKSNYPSLFSNKNLKVLIIGSGGASRAIYYALTKEPIQTVDITNRTIEKAEIIASLNKGNTNTKIYTLEEVDKVLDQYDLIIQTTSLGMEPNEEQTPLKINKLKKNAVVSDIVYQPMKTKFLKQAEALNANIHLGHTMLLYQAQYAFEIWTGKNVSVTNMDIQLQDILEGR